MIRNRQNGVSSKVRITKDDGKISNSGFESSSYIFSCYYSSEMRLNARFIFSKCLYK